MSAFQSGDFAIGDDLVLALGHRQRIPTIPDLAADVAAKAADLDAMTQCRAIFDAAVALHAATSAAGVDRARAHIGVHDTRMARTAATIDGATRFDVANGEHNGFTSVVLGPVTFYAGEVLP